MKPIERARQEMTASGASAEHSDFMAHMGRVLAAGVKLKKVMLDKGIASAKAKCPMCAGGYLHGRLAGRKNHMRMWCDGEGCNAMMME
jgi:hypothetical protein